jgi:hypothetical protein
MDRGINVGHPFILNLYGELPQMTKCKSAGHSALRKLFQDRSQESF